MEAEGRDSEDWRGGRPRRGGTAGMASEDRQGLSLSTETDSTRLPNCSWNTFGDLATTLYGPSYNGDRGGPGAPRRMKTKSASMRRCRGPVDGEEDGRGLVGRPTGGGRRRFSRKIVAGGSAVSTSSPGKAIGTP